MKYVMQSNSIGGDWVGRVVDGSFPLLEWRGDGDGSSVYRTRRQEPEDRKAAIKLIPGDRNAVEERLAEWAAAAELSHPHLTRVLHAGRDSIDGVELAYAVTEYADEILANVLRERPLTGGEAREILEPVLDTLAYLHGQDFVYGRLKPSNIMAVDDRLKFAGDDLYRAGHSSHAAAEQGVHAAPEAFSGTISPAADLWSLGATLVEVLTQHPPTFDVQSNRDPVVPDSVPEPFAAIARACLRRDPAERATLDQVRRMLEGKPAAPIEGASPTPETTWQPVKTGAGEIETTTSEATRSDGDTTFRARTKRLVKNRVVALLALLVAVAATIAIFAALSRKAPRPEPPGNQAQAPSAAEQGKSQPAEGSTARERLDGKIPSRAGVTEKGEVADRVMPEPAVKASQTIHGKVQVEVRVVVTPDGRISDAAFASRGVSRYFANLTMGAARQWRFAPARVGGQTVQSVWVLRFVFRQGGAEASAREQSP